MKELSSLRGVGKARLDALAKAGIFTMRDLLFTLPIAYKDTLHPTPVAELTAGQTACVSVFLKAPAKLSRFNGRTAVTAKMTDGTKTLTVHFYQQPWMKDSLKTDTEYLLYGRVEEKSSGFTMICPSVEHDRALIPKYRTLPGLPDKTFSGLVKQALEQIDDCVQETLPQGVRTRHHLCEINFALRQTHFPDSVEALQIAKRRLAFESLLLYQAAMGLTRGARQEGVQIQTAEPEAFFVSLPFPPTGAQRRVLNEIAQDLQAPRAMARMVQGDVGCGKTVVAFGAIYLSAKGGYQSALMAPTEILARQHLESAKKMLEPLGITCGLLIGGMKAAERREALESIKTGRWQAVIGTHALLSEGVEYHRLGLVVTDEQHRFGVRQRKKLADKAEQEPNALVMSATPIPRSLALVLYGDLDLSVIDEMPPGRTPVETRVVPEEKRAGLYEFIHAETKAGHQTYIVCPLVEESEAIEAASAQSMYTNLSSSALHDLRLGLTYGSQDPAEKEKTINAFAHGELDVLVATTVIEVGVNVPSASVMVIENADRFGLSQLHQLRGRVGRGAAKSWCFLMAKKNARLNALCKTSDGFEIAREDLRQRGPGDFLGTRQHGERLLPGMTDGADVRLIEETRDCLKTLRAPEYAAELDAVLASARMTYDRLTKDIAFN